ncbi:phospholipase D-like domain-containing protein [Mucilaginibacter sp. UYCu711]|uniref:phospholipase D-like domain-containing protein n=1 Tax=Mucilaginibacter sp. UYCu711 TaxID=3156339 RepID=UPI003D1DE1E5
MRNRITKNGLEGSVIIGAYGALISIKITDEKVNTPDFLGFEIKRDDNTENESYPLKGFKYFAESGVPSVKGQLFDTDKQPIQSCYWEDFSVKPTHKYIYHIIPVYGKPKNLTYGASVDVPVESETAEGEFHSVHFNMGVAGSLAYATKFQNQRPDHMTPDQKALVVKWLSRGLQEALLGFIDDAIANGKALRAAFYEFTYDPVLQKLKDAISAGLDVKIIYDSRGEEDENEAAITKNELPKTITKNGEEITILIPRKNDPQVPAHNKFMVLITDAGASEVWTGSTNITDKGILGQSNVGHRLKDPGIASKYLDYWDDLSSDPAHVDIQKNTKDIQPDIIAPAGFNDKISVFFSPREDKLILKTYSAFITEAKQMVCGIFPFSFNKDMKAAFSVANENLKYIMVDKIGNADGITKTDNSIIVNGAYFTKPMFDWLQEVNSGLLLNKKPSAVIGTNYVHNKLLLIDPLSSTPKIIVGSANFSDPSVLSNDENTLVISGGTELQRISDIYFTEFYRIFHHFFVRKATEEINNGKDTSVDSPDNPLHLKTDNSWLTQFDSDKIKVKMQGQISTMPLKF